MNTHWTLSILVQATLCKTSTGQAQVGSLFHPTQPSLRMWAVPKTVNAAPRADREERQSEAAELRVKRRRYLPPLAQKATWRRAVPCDTFPWQEQLHKAIDRDDLPEGLTAQPPPWWKPGQPLTRPVEEVIEMRMEDDKGDGEDRAWCRSR